MDQAPGTPLSVLIHNKNAHSNYLVEFGKVLATLHTIKGTGYGPFQSHAVGKSESSFPNLRW